MKICENLLNCSDSSMSTNDALVNETGYRFLGKFCLVKLTFLILMLHKKNSNIHLNIGKCTLCTAQVDFLTCVYYLQYC